MKRVNSYSIWSEGFAGTGVSQDAVYVGISYGASFRDACSRRFRNDEQFDSKRMTYWGCKLFDNEHDARAAFG